MKHPRLTSAIAKGIETGLRECENQFQHHRWNCISTYEIASFGQNRSVQGTKEGAFVNAIVAAGAAHSVALACARNNITGCICATSNWENGGCSNNIAHGIETSERFLQGSRGAKRKRYELQIMHNREAGRQAVRKSLVPHCNCHGVSGACTSKTCWEILSSSFERVGRFLKARYETATLVEPSYTDTREGKTPIVLILPGTVFVKPRKEKLVYLDKSPTYCDPIPNKGVAGTRARLCDHLSKDTDGCDALCCGRGYNKIVFTTTKRCRCRFFWCCEVKCATCKIEREQTVCK
ncbi:Wnt-7b-like [Paramuricea clavata]|nr:Wnt-7b-like [Paramuricea clavata]